MRINHDNIKQFLWTPGKYFVIPDFQRRYSWDKANIDSFIEDLESVLHGNKKHYFGSIVYIIDGHNCTIIDGQQRATTVLLMLTALYHIATDRPSSSKVSAGEIKDNYLHNRQDYAENAHRIKLKAVANDNTIFENIFDRTELSKNSKDSKLYQAYNIFYTYFNERNNLDRYVDILDNFEVVTIALDATDDNPQRIFESINSTGLPLTDGDKIRNFALMLNNKEARDIVLKKYWEKIETQLTEINKDYISDFFKYYLTSYLQKEVKIEQVYPEFKKLFNLSIGSDQSNIDKLERFYGSVLSYLNHYSFLKFNRRANDEYQIIIDKGFRLNFLKIETPYPFLMRVMDEYVQGKIEDKGLIKIFEIVESYLTRRIVCNIATTGLNNLFSTLHKDVDSYLSEYPEEEYPSVLSYILINKSGGLRFPKQSEVENAIKNNPIYSQRDNYINFVLSSIDDQSRESKKLKQIANRDIDLSIEHIMPQTLNNQWKVDLGENWQEIHAKHIDTLPNLTLTGYNSKYSNKDFKFKKTIENGFNDSPLVINQFIKSFDKWDLSALEKRGEWWLNQINKIWPIPDSTFAPKSRESQIAFFDDIDLTGTKIKALIMLGEIIECNSWSSVFQNIMKKFFMLDSKLYDYVTTDSYLHSYINADKDVLRTPNLIEGTTYYYESNTNTNLKRDILARLAEHLELNKTDIKVIIAKSVDDETFDQINSDTTDKVGLVKLSEYIALHSLAGVMGNFLSAINKFGADIYRYEKQNGEITLRRGKVKHGGFLWYGENENGVWGWTYPAEDQMPEGFYLEDSGWGFNLTTEASAEVINTIRKVYESKA